MISVYVVPPLVLSCHLSAAPVPAPAAVKLTVLFSQDTNGAGCAVILGRVLTVIDIDAVPVHPVALATFTVYTVLTAGDAATGLVVVLLKPAAGDHTNVKPAGTGANVL